MSGIDSVIFDLDGTLWDTSRPCAIGWNNVLRRNGIVFREITVEDQKRVVGLPHEQCIRTIFGGLPEDQIKILIEQTAVEDNVVIKQLGGDLFGGVEEGLAQLADRLPLFIVSNCQSGYIETFLEITGFQKYFWDYECWGNTFQAKGKNLASIITRNSLKKPIYVGDTEGDLQAARACHIPFWFVKYGFGHAKDADATFDEFKEMVAAILKSSS